jgi:hypothetical protein
MLQYSPEDLSDITFTDDRIYEHSIIRFNYTTYDMRRASDSVNPRNHADVMVRAPEEEDHPYYYGRVIGVYHANVSYRGGPPELMDFLHVRWFGIDWEYSAAKRLPRIGFFDWDLEPHEAFGFVNPADVVRGVHLVPAFAAGMTSRLLPNPSLARRNNGPSVADWTNDWAYFYVNMYAICRDTGRHSPMATALQIVTCS